MLFEKEKLTARLKPSHVFRGHETHPWMDVTGCRNRGELCRFGGRTVPQLALLNSFAKCSSAVETEVSRERTKLNSPFSDIHMYTYVPAAQYCCCFYA